MYSFRYAEDASFSDCIRAVLPAVLGERGGKRKGGREKCCVVCCVVCCVLYWDACVLCCVMRAVVLRPLHTFYTPSSHLLYTPSTQHKLTRSNPAPNPTVVDRIDLSSASDRKELIKRATMTYVEESLYGFYYSVCGATHMCFTTLRHEKFHRGYR